ncbi:MAG TPA: Mov34/MPN/PAD-1 family protein [Candidatus Paceibacterota bacterium]|nr:Mov34/MPN/PAD-1 family protein [Candidatus Paceibacterota bacterium]
MKIHVHDGTHDIPEENCVLVTKEGFMMKSKTNWVDAVVPIKSVSTLQSLEPRATVLLPPIPVTVFAQAVLFFYAVYKAKRIESAILLHYRSADQDWQITVPKQDATGGSVHYNAAERLPGYLCVGTMHSHCDMGAFHSGTDTHDETGHDGIHITIGRLGKFPLFDLDGEIVVKGHRFPLPMEQVQGLLCLEEERKERTLFSVLWERPPSKFYALDVPHTFDLKVPDEWVERVKERFAWGSERPTVVQANSGGTYVPEQDVQLLSAAEVEQMRRPTRERSDAPQTYVPEDDCGIIDADDLGHRYRLSRELPTRRFGQPPITVSPQKPPRDTK